MEDFSLLDIVVDWVKCIFHGQSQYLPQGSGGNFKAGAYFVLSKLLFALIHACLALCIP